MTCQQHTLILPAFTRGIHLITPQINASLHGMLEDRSDSGLLHLFLQHTSASLSINENADPDVRIDAENWLNRIAPERHPSYRHILEGDDDLPAHLKSMILGVSLTVPVKSGALALGTWQGIYLCEHRHEGGRRRILMTLMT